jgi:hypothetical protein
LHLQQVVLVAHDASGPPAIDWALAHADRVAALVLLNTYYCAMPTLRPPEAILLNSTPLVRNVARAVFKAFDNWLFRKMYWWQVGRFMREAADREEFLPLLYRQFAAMPSAQPAFFRLNEDLLFTVRDRTKRIPQMKAFRPPVRIIFGASDPYLNVGVARRFHKLFPTSELFLLPGAYHYVQIDEPEQVAHLLLSTPLAHEAEEGERSRSSGFGQATAALLTAQGFLVFGTSRAPAHNEASSFELLPLDVRSETSVQACIQTILGRTGRIDLLVNNAGYAQGGALEENSLEDARA